MSSYWGQIPQRVVRRNTRVYNTGRMQRPDMRKVTDSATGKTYLVPDDDYRQYLGQGEAKDKDKSFEDYMSAAFNDNKNGFSVQIVGNGSNEDGHILKLEYSVYYKVLRVTFRNNHDVVAYLNVPNSVAGELFALAQSNNTQISASDGKLRHVLGMRFWDLVRIRGTIHGTRYPFKYVSESVVDSNNGGSSVPDWSKSQFVVLDNGKAKALDALSENEKKEYDDRLAVVSNRGDGNSPYSIDKMYSFVNRAKIEDSVRKSLLSEMDAINKGKGSEADKSRTMYNYLYIHGLL